MKIKKIMMGLLCITMLAACGKGNNGYIEEDKKILSQFDKSYKVVDFMAAKHYYKLPCLLSEFIEQKWKFEADSEDGVQSFEDVIDAQSFTQFKIRHGKSFFATVVVSNTSSEPTSIKDCTVNEITFHPSESKSDIILKKGFTSASTLDQGAEVYDQKLKSGEHEIMVEEGDVETYNLYFDKDTKMLSFVKMKTEISPDFKRFKTAKQIEKDIQTKKESIEKKSSTYLPLHYDKIVSDFLASKSISLSFTGTITEEITATSSFDVTGKFGKNAFMIKDLNGNEYCIIPSTIAADTAKEAFDQLNIGDTISFWGSMNNRITYNGKTLPYLYPDIIEKDGIRTIYE